MWSNTTNDSSTSPITDVVQLSLYVTVIVIGSLGNCLVCLAIYQQKKRRPNEFFILNLALTDLGASVFSIPLDLTELLTGKFPLGYAMCHIVYPVQTILMGASVLTLLCLSSERHRAIVTPLKPRIQVKTAFWMIAATWIISVMAVSPYASILHLEGDQCLEKWPRVVYMKTFTMSMFLLLYFIPLVIITANYVRVMQKLFCERERVRQLFSGRNHRLCRHTKMRAEQNIKVVKVFVTAVVVFAVCLLPNHVLWIWHDFGEGKYYIYFNKVVVYCNIMVYINSAINPFIFGKLKLKKCFSTKNKGNNYRGSSFLSKMASKAPSFGLRARAMSDVTSRRPSVFKWRAEEKEASV